MFFHLFFLPTVARTGEAFVISNTLFIHRHPSCTSKININNAKRGGRSKNIQSIFSLRFSSTPAHDDDGKSDDVNSTFPAKSENIRQGTIASNPNLVSPRTARILAPLAVALSTTTSWAATIPATTANTNDFSSTLKRYFPGSIPSTTVQLRVLSTLRKRKYFPFNTMLGTCLSSEEVLDTPTSVVSQLKTRLCNTKDGGVYHLGGLAGLPFSGPAGVQDMLRHAPSLKDGGKLVVVYGPNVGIGGSDTKVGSLQRIGNESGSADEACGVIVRAYQSIVGGTAASSSSSDFATQEDYILKKIKSMPLEEYRKKGGDDYALVKITQEMYGLTSDFLTKEIEKNIKNYPNLEVTLIGGIVVNRDHGAGAEGGDDWFQPLMAKAYSDGKVTDLYGEVFGDLEVPIARS